MTFEAMTPEIACATLSNVGLKVLPADVRVEARDERWVVRLPGRRLAWFAASDAGLQVLKKERRVLRLLQARCSFEVPRVLIEDAAAAFDVRSMIGCDHDPEKLDATLRDDAEAATVIGQGVGRILSEQHARVEKSEVADWLPRRPSWPKSAEWVGERIKAVVDDRDVLRRAAGVMKAYDELHVPEADCALVHTDVALHNLGFDEARTVRGLFDYEDAAWADRHHDFRYLVGDGDREDLLTAAMSSYEALTGYAIQRDRVMLYNAACALTYLAYRAGTRPEGRSCGRTLDEELRWTKIAVARVAAPEGAGSQG